MPRLLTYNVHRCLGVDGRLSPARTAEVIASSRADIVDLQELDVRRARTGELVLLRKPYQQAELSQAIQTIFRHATVEIRAAQAGTDATA